MSERPMCISMLIVAVVRPEIHGGMGLRGKAGVTPVRPKARVSQGVEYLLSALADAPKLRIFRLYPEEYTWRSGSTLRFF